MRFLRGLGLFALLFTLATAGCSKKTNPGGGGGGSGGFAGNGGSGGIAGSGGTGGNSACEGGCPEGQVCDETKGSCTCACLLPSAPGGMQCRPNTFCDPGSCACTKTVGQIGSACASPADCGGTGAGAVCLENVQNVDFPAGYCSRPCGTATPCPGGAVCTTFGCIADCVDTTDCRDGYTCTAVSQRADSCGNAGPQQKACFPKRTYSSCTGADCGGIGAPCAQDSDCVSGAVCLTGGGWADGYCSKLVTGTTCSSGDCGSKNTECAKTSQAGDPHNPCLSGQSTYLCLNTCDPSKQDACRDGYRCAPNGTVGSDPCNSDADCAARPGTSCITVLNYGKMCTKRCDHEKIEGCPSGYFCSDLGADPGDVCLPMCNTDVDCNQAAGETCANYGLGAFLGQPTFSCTQDQDCAKVPGAKCSKPTAEGTCSISQPCPQNSTCINGVCTGNQGICLAECASDADCKLTEIPGETRHSTCVNGSCNFGVCRASNPHMGSCLPYDCSDDSNCRSGCTADAMCSSGKCDLTTGACMMKACAGTGPDDSISEARKACGASSNCSTGQVAGPDGYCRTPCQHDADCGLASSCSGGYCQAKGAVCNAGEGACALACESDVSCTTGFHCGDEGHCIKNCTANSDCPFNACDQETGRCSQPCPSTANGAAGCGLARVCTDNVCYQSCIGDGARTCPSDRFCETTSGSCLLRCDATGSPGCTGTQVCDPGSGQCIDRCPGRPCTEGVCDESAGLCVECLVDMDCTATGATCDTTSHKCIVACDPANLSACTPPQTCCSSGPNADTCQDTCP